MSDERLDVIIRNAARDYHVPKTPPRDEMWARIEEARRNAAAGAGDRARRTTWLWSGAGIAAVLLVGIGIGRVVERRQGTGAREMAAARPDSAASAATTTGSSSASDLTGAPSGTRAGDTGAVPGGREPSYGGTTRGVLPPGDVASRDRAGSDRGTAAPNDNPTSSEGLAFRLAVLQHLTGTEAMLTSFRTEAKSGEVDARLTSWARNLLRTTHLLQASSVASSDPTLKRLLDDLELVLLQIAQYTAKSPHRAEELELIERSIDKRGVMSKLRATNPAAPMPAGT